MTALQTIQAALPINEYGWYVYNYFIGALLGLMALVVFAILLWPVYAYSVMVKTRISQKWPSMTKAANQMPRLAICFLISLAGFTSYNVAKKSASFSRNYEYKVLTETFAGILSGKTHLRKISTTYPPSVTLSLYAIKGNFQGIPIEEDLPAVRVQRKMLDVLNERVFTPQGITLLGPEKPLDIPNT